MSAKLSDIDAPAELLGEPRLGISPAPEKPRWRAGVSNVRIGWITLVLGAGTGLVLGLWSFSGPVPVPAFLGAYDDVARRLARLGHIACFGLGILNLLVARELPRLTLPPAWVWLASLTMNVGNVLLPTALFAAAAYHPLKYAMPMPALSVFVALAIVCYGVLARSQGDGHERP